MLLDDGFTELPKTDKIRRGEVVFNREQAKFSISKDYRFLIDEPSTRVKTLIEEWILKDLLGGSDARNVWYTFNTTLGERGNGSFYVHTSNPSFGIWNSYQFLSVRTARDRLSAAHALLIFKDKEIRSHCYSLILLTCYGSHTLGGSFSTTDCTALHACCDCISARHKNRGLGASLG
uniref:Uncharacterized protein n=1 Tax=Romanomermis culicivorax TaxID=13658 RepID=A0A915IQR7_ROMCU